MASFRVGDTEHTISEHQKCFFKFLQCFEKIEFDSKRDWDDPEGGTIMTLETDISPELYSKLEPIANWKLSQPRFCEMTGLQKETMNLLCYDAYKFFKKKKTMRNMCKKLDAAMLMKKQYGHALVKDMKLVAWEFRCNAMRQEYDSSELEDKKRRLEIHAELQEIHDKKWTLDAEWTVQENILRDEYTKLFECAPIGEEMFNDFKLRLVYFIDKQEKVNVRMNTSIKELYSEAQKEYWQLSAWHTSCAPSNIHFGDTPQHQKIRVEFNVEYFEKKLEELRTNMLCWEKLNEHFLELVRISYYVINNCERIDIWKKEDVEMYDA